MKRRHILVVAALVLLIALTIAPWAGPTTANAAGCRVFGAVSAQVAQTGDLGTIVSDVATAAPQLVGITILGEQALFCP